MLVVLIHGFCLRFWFQVLAWAPALVSSNNGLWPVRRTNSFCHSFITATANKSRIAAACTSTPKAETVDPQSKMANKSNHSCKICIWLRGSAEMNMVGEQPKMISSINIRLSHAHTYKRKCTSVPQHRENMMTCSHKTRKRKDNKWKHWYTGKNNIEMY